MPTKDSRIRVDAGDGLTLQVTGSGSGPAVVLLHGFTGSGTTWGALSDALSPAYRVITIDLPGHGGTSAPAEPSRYSLRRFADDMICVLDALRVDRARLVGYSLGGRAALHVALAHPHRLTGLVLESCSPGLADPDERKARAKADAELARTIETRGIPAFVDHWERLPLWASQASLPAFDRAEQRTGRLGNSAAGLAGSLRGAGAAVEPAVTPRLVELALPTLVIAGALDLKYAAIAAAMAAALPQARLEIVPDAGHAVHLERPAYFASLVRQFLDSFDR